MKTLQADGGETLVIRKKMANSSQQVVVKVNGQEFLVELGNLNTKPIIVVVDGHTYEVEVEDRPIEPQPKPTAAGSKPPMEISIQETAQEQTVGPASSTGSGSQVKAPLPGDIVDVNVESGQLVSKGDSLCIIDAMKMKNAIRSPHDGRIANVEVSIGQSVDYGDVLITFE